MIKLSLLIEDSIYKAFTEDLGGYDDKKFLQKAFALTIVELTDLLKVTLEDLKQANRGSTGFYGSIRRKDAQFLKGRIRLIKSVVKSKKSDPNFVPEWLR